ncbi:MAG: hypothetical protein ACLGHY_03150 [Gammaproteobacteria bacterium]
MRWAFALLVLLPVLAACTSTREPGASDLGSSCPPAYNGCYAD